MTETEHPFLEAFCDVSKDFIDWDRSSELDRTKSAYETSNKRFDDAVEYAVAVQDIVSSTIRFQSIKNSPNRYLSPDEIRTFGATNCYGNSSITSEILEQSGVEHFIAFVNQHAFVWMFDDKTNKSFIIDSHPSLRCETTSAISGEIPAEWSLGSGPLHTDMFLDPIALTSGITDVGKRLKAEKSPWLGIDHTNKKFRGFHEDGLFLPMRVYPSLPGRDILQLYHNSVVLSNLEKLPELSKVFSDMDGTYPDVDKINQLQFAKKALGLLINNKYFDEAIQTAQAIDASLIVCDRSAQSFVLADTMRKIGMVSGNALYLEEALGLYESLRHGGELRLGKIAKTKKYIKKLQSTI